MSNQLLKTTVISVIAVAALSLSTSALAGVQCTTEPKEKWMTEDAMKKQITDAGYRIAKFKITGGQCYEIYGTDSSGKKVEIYYNPVNGNVVKQK